MSRTVVMFSVLMSVLLFSGIISGNFAHAQPSNLAKKITDTKDLKQDTHKKTLEKIQDLKTKKENSKKLLALAAFKLQKIGSN